MSKLSHALRLALVFSVLAFGVASFHSHPVRGQAENPVAATLAPSLTKATPSPVKAMPSPIKATPSVTPAVSSSIKATPTPTPTPAAMPVASPDAAVAQKAFLAAATVLLHPRCANCHAAGNVPTQGDLGVVHKGTKTERGPEGRGVAPFKCALCHKAVNRDTGPILAPGAPDWRMPSQALPMVFAKRTPAELCRQLKDSAQNGGRTPALIVEHIKKEALVLWGWEPGLKRTKPPLTHEEFVKQMEDWVNNGAACPQ